jgi:glycosyltransferase involved in cell wall biosynthesis
MAPSDITFSICMPVYNGRRWLAETLESVRQQTHRHWELIIVEDASPEPARDIVAAFAATVPQRVVYHVNPVNLQTAHTRDEAHRLAAHDHIAPLDCDDLWQPGHLAEYAQIFAAEGADFVFNGCTCFRDHIDNIEAHFVPTPELHDRMRLAYLQRRYWLQPSSVAFTRRILQRVGPWSRGIEIVRRDLRGLPERGEDRNFFIHVMQAGVEPRWTGTISTYYRQHPDSLRGSATHLPVLRASMDHYHGLMPGVPVRPQRIYLAHSCANAGRSLRSDARYAHLSALYYFRAWRWYPCRLDRLLRAACCWLKLT